MNTFSFLRFFSTIDNKTIDDRHVCRAAATRDCMVGVASAPESRESRALMIKAVPIFFLPLIFDVSASIVRVWQLAKLVSFFPLLWLRTQFIIVIVVNIGCWQTPISPPNTSDPQLCLRLQLTVQAEIIGPIC